MDRKVDHIIGGDARRWLVGFISAAIWKPTSVVQQPQSTVPCWKHKHTDFMNVI
jgi:hypothetical protein